MTSLVAVRIQLPSPVLDQYEQQARTAEVPVEELLSRRLLNAQIIDSEKPLVIDDENRRRLERLFGKNLSTSQELVVEVHRAVSVSIAGQVIDLSPRLLERLRSRSIRVPFDEFLAGLIIRQLEEYVGMR